MTSYTLKTTPQEADDIASNRKAFIFRSNQYNYRVGDSISFRVVKSQKMVKHPIEDMHFIVTYVSENVPIEKGFVAIGIRKGA